MDSAYQELRAIIPTLEGQVAKLSAQLQSCEAEKNSLRAQLTATESQLASAESKLATSQAQLTAANQLNSKLQSDLQATGSDSARIAEELRSEAGDLKAQLDAQAAKLLASETGIAALTSELSTLTGRFADAEATIASQAKLIDAAAGETSALLREKQALEDQLTEASAREDVLSAEVSTLMQQLADRVDASELDSAKAEIVSLLSQLEAHAALQEENKRLSTEV